MPNTKPRSRSPTHNRSAGGAPHDAPPAMIQRVIDGDSYPNAPRLPEQRKEKLLRVLGRPHGTGRLQYVDHVIGNGNAMLREARRMNVEGIVSKLRGQRYAEGRREASGRMAGIRHRCLASELGSGNAVIGNTGPLPSSDLAAALKRATMISAAKPTSALRVRWPSGPRPRCAALRRSDDKKRPSRSFCRMQNAPNRCSRMFRSPETKCVL
jgi:hypothetical protein